MYVEEEWEDRGGKELGRGWREGQDK